MAFSKLCELLNGYVSYVVISFIDIYKNVKHNSHVLNLCDINEDEFDLLAREFYNIANKNGMEIFTCGEKKKFLNYGFINGACLSKDYATKLMNSVNKIVKFKKQSNRKIMTVIVLKWLILELITHVYLSANIVMLIMMKKKLTIII